MLGVNRREHLFLAKELVVVLFGFGIDAGIVIGIPSLRACRARIDRLVQTAQAPRTGLPGPRIVAMRGIGVAIAQEAGAASVLGREFRTEQEQPQAVGLLEDGIDRQRLDFGGPYEIGTRVLAGVSLGDFQKMVVYAGVKRVRTQKTETHRLPLKA